MVRKFLVNGKNRQTLNVFKQHCMKCQKVFLIIKNLFFPGENIKWNCKSCKSDVEVTVSEENGNKIVKVRRNLEEKTIIIEDSFGVKKWTITEEKKDE